MTRVDRSCICDPMVSATQSDELTGDDLRVLHALRMTTVESDDEGVFAEATLELYIDHDATWS